MKALFILSQQNLYLDTWKKSALKAGFSVIDVVSTGEEAQELFLKDNDYDLVICDEQLSGRLNGCVTFESLRLSRKMKCTTGFMLVSSRTFSDFYTFPIRTRPDYVVTKPYNIKHFENGILSCLENLRETFSIREALKEGDNEVSLQYCLDFNQASPNSWIRNLYCEILFSTGQINLLIEYCLEEVRKHRSYWAIILLVQAYLAIERYVDAVSLIERLPDQLKGTSTVLKLLSECYESIGHYSLSTTYLNKAIAASPDNYYFYDSHSDITFKMKDYKVSLRSISKAIDITMNTEMEVEDRYRKLSDITLIYSKQEDADSSLLKKSSQMMRHGYKKYPCTEEFDLCAKLFSVFAAHHAGSNVEAASELSALVEQYQSGSDGIINPEIAEQIISLSIKLPVSETVKKNVSAWLAKDTYAESKTYSINSIERANELLAEASQLYENDMLSETEITIQKGLALIPGHAGLNILQIEMLMTLAKLDKIGAGALINNAFRCFERMTPEKEGSQLFERYCQIKIELNKISASKL